MIDEKANMAISPNDNKKCVVKAHDVVYNNATTDNRRSIMEDNVMVPYIVLESERARQEKGRKHERTLWFIVVIVLLLLLFGTNAAWINYEAQFEDVVTETYNSEVDGEGGLAIVNRDGSVNYGGESELYPHQTESP